MDIIFQLLKRVFVFDKEEIKRLVARRPDSLCDWNLFLECQKFGQGRRLAGSQKRDVRMVPYDRLAIHGRQIAMPGS